MNDTLGNLLRGVARGIKLSHSEWRRVVEDLLDLFRDFISEDFICEEEYLVDRESGCFSRWFWSRPASSFLLPIWSAVIAGEVGEGTFRASVSLFLFHGATQERLASTRGGAYLSFSLVEDLSGSYFWESQGWTVDEWGEWEDVKFIKDND